MIHVRRIATVLALLSPVPAVGQGLNLPSAAVLAGERAATFAEISLPNGAFQNGSVPVEKVEGNVTLQAWHLRSEGLTTLQILAPLRDQLSDDGFEIVYQCMADECGGFDFRYAMEVLPEPTMHIDLGDFHYLLARRNGGKDAEYLSLVVSRSSVTGFVQITQVSNDGKTLDTRVSTATTKGDTSGTGVKPLASLATRLEDRGRAVLNDLAFATGSSTLDQGPFGSLEELAAYLKDHPEKSVTLVGHTDAEGDLGGNIALSKRRAESVRAFLTDTLGVPTSQVAAEGVGYLAPLASNLTDQGRATNRRVEAVLTSTQ